MAEKRMMTKKVTDADDFVTLPSSAQALYLHLNMGADDDGFNNQVQLAMFKAHASIDDVKILLAKRFLLQFESGVFVIKHWRMANALRKDRYNPTAYQEELAQLKIKGNGSYTIETESWLPNGCQMVATDKISIDKDSVDKNSIDNINNINIRPSESSYKWLIDAWNELESYGITPVRRIAESSKRAEMIRSRLRTYTKEEFLEAIENVKSSDFLLGNKTNFKITFDWLIKPNNFPKVLEGNYNNQNESKPRSGTVQQLDDFYKMASEWAAEGDD